MPRERTGSPRWSEKRQCWQARVPIPGGGREPVDLVDSHGKSLVAKEDKERARSVAKIIAEKAKRDGIVPIACGETTNEWFTRFLAARTARGLASVSDDKSRYENHISAKLGTLAVRAITRGHIEELVEELDAKVQTGKLSWKTASHTWGLVSRMFKDMVNAKRRDLRARDDNPALGVQGPDRGDAKAKVYLWPSEFEKLIASAEVPLVWKRFFTLTTYLYARAGEVNALTWSDVDLEHGVVHVHASVNRRTGEVGSTKTGVTRRVPIEASLRPLLAAMHVESSGKGRVSPVSATDKKLSRQLQRCLRLAGVDREDLFIDDATRKSMTAHDLRATGVTWAALRGDDVLKIKQRAGHKLFSTTEIYIREAENLRAVNFGTPFPPLPADMLKPPPPESVGNRPVGRFVPLKLRQNSGGAGNRTSKKPFLDGCRILQESHSLPCL